MFLPAPEDGLGSFCETTTMNHSTTYTAKIADRFGNSVEITVCSALPESELIMKAAESSATRLMDVVRKPNSTTHVTSNT